MSTAAVTPPAGVHAARLRPAQARASIGLNRFTAAAPEIAAAVLVRVEIDMPELAEAPWRSHATDLDRLAAELTRRLELAERGVAVEQVDLDRFAAHYRAAARLGAPLRTMQRFSRATIAHTLTELWARAEPEDVTDLLRFSRWIGRHNGVVERLLVQVYCELLDRRRDGDDAREALAERLLAGFGSEDPDMPGIPAQCYLVVVLAAGADPRSEVPTGTVAAVLDGLRHLIVPVALADERDAAWRGMVNWVSGHGSLQAAGAFSDAASDIPASAAEARRLLRAAQVIMLPAGLVGPQDLVLESVLTAHRDSQRHLVALLDPLAADERLLETLVAFYANDLDRTRTAAVLFLSRGGLALRLDRIGQLTGLDPRSTRGIQVLGTALSARALRDAETGAAD